MSENECKCNYCEVILSCHASLLRHQKNAKKCLDKQKEKKEEKINIYTVQIESKEVLLKVKDEQLKEQKTQLKVKDEQLKSKDEKIKELEKWKEDVIKEIKDNKLNVKTAGRDIEIAGRDINNINNTQINNILAFTPDLSKPHLDEICKQITPALLMDQYGLTKLFVNEVARNERGGYGIINSNKKNPVLQYQNEKGELKKDYGGFEVTKNFRECAKIPIIESLKSVKSKVADLTDFSMIEENATNENKFVKNVAIKLHKDNVDDELLKIQENKGEYKKEKIGEEKVDTPAIRRMKAQLEILKRTTFNSDIKVNMNKFYVEDVDRKTEYDDDEEHFIWIKNTYNDQKTEKKTTYNK
jgi:hypothetical protein